MIADWVGSLKGNPTIQFAHGWPGAAEPQTNPYILQILQKATKETKGQGDNIRLFVSFCKILGFGPLGNCRKQDARRKTSSSNIAVPTSLRFWTFSNLERQRVMVRPLAGARGYVPVQSPKAKGDWYNTDIAGSWYQLTLWGRPKQAGDRPLRLGTAGEGVLTNPAQRTRLSACCENCAFHAFNCISTTDWASWFGLIAYWIRLSTCGVFTSENTRQTIICSLFWSDLAK